MTRGRQSAAFARAMAIEDQSLLDGLSKVIRDQHLAKLLLVPHYVDNDDRDTRAVALSALGAHGFHDHHALLRVKPTSLAGTMSSATTSIHD